MASRIVPRSVKDATRFTSTTPHATSKSAVARTPPSATPRPSPRVPGETPEQRVRRLRQAHLAAQKAQVSRTDRMIDASRRFLDVAHRWTVGGIVVFTAVAGVVSVYSVWDMLQYNRARRAEWIEAQRKLEADSLAAARIAYLRGDATEEQVLLVEEANRDAQEKGVKLPPLLSPPEHRTHFEEHVKPTFSRPSEEPGRKTDGKGSDDGGSIQSMESNKARDARESEKRNQVMGGSLDQLGLETDASAPKSGKRGWWPW
ncbi:hypothetical protein UVI_02012640 [Ustilaginoidea virens]|uniref:Cytochrome oxidase c assembly domain-containing protein n=1 Tax=Ustilaginoidea virens TaxID=1159556 RepID=A0A1B5L2F0_USTVR|nr:hypothetical protein UVI_02012640 [Ustilaginoidea virens]